MTIPSPILPPLGTSGSIWIIQCLSFPICQKDTTYSRKWWASTEVFLKSVQRVFWHVVNIGYIVYVTFIMLKIIKVTFVSLVKMEQNIKVSQYERTFPKHPPPPIQCAPLLCLPFHCAVYNITFPVPWVGHPPTLIHPERAKSRVPLLTDPSFH